MQHHFQTLLPEIRYGFHFQLLQLIAHILRDDVVMYLMLLSPSTQKKNGKNVFLALLLGLFFRNVVVAIECDGKKINTSVNASSLENFFAI